MIFADTHPQAHDIARHYDELDVFYREIWGEHIHHGLWLRGDESPEEATQQMAEYLLQFAAIDVRDKVCDVGCGYGGTSRLLARKFGAEVVGLTLSETQRDYAESMESNRVPDPRHPRPTYLCQDWLSNEFEDQSFDAVIALECLEHMPDKARFFSEAARVLKPGGRLVFSTWLSRENVAAWEVKYLLEPICSQGHLPNIGSASEYRPLIRNAGLDLVHYEDLSRRVKKTWQICLTRTLRGVSTDPKYLRFLINAKAENRVFALTIILMWLAYTTGSLQYGIFAVRKPD